jgi:hypothetical protein
MQKKAKAVKHAIMAAANKNATTMMTTIIKINPHRTRKKETPHLTKTRNPGRQPTVVGASVAVEEVVVESVENALNAAEIVTENVADIVVEIEIEAETVAEIAVEIEIEAETVATEEVVASEADEVAEVQGDTTMTSMCSRASVPEIR